MLRVNLRLTCRKKDRLTRREKLTWVCDLNLSRGTGAFTNKLTRSTFSLATGVRRVKWKLARLASRYLCVYRSTLYSPVALLSSRKVDKLRWQRNQISQTDSFARLSSQRTNTIKTFPSW